MVIYHDLASRLLQIVEHRPGCDLDEVVSECADLTWNQVFLELDRLSRAGEVVLTQSGRGHYSVSPREYSSQRVTQVH
jgi:hypothetical protein